MTSIIIISLCSAFGLVYLFEMVWQNRPPNLAIQWDKQRAMRFAWAITGIVIGTNQLPVGLLCALVGLPVCLNHLSLVDKQPGTQIHVGDVFAEMFQTARISFRRFMERTKIGSRQ